MPGRRGAATAWAGPTVGDGAWSWIPAFLRLAVEKMPELRPMRFSDQMSPIRLENWLAQLDEHWGRRLPYAANLDTKDVPFAGDVPDDVVYFHRDDTQSSGPMPEAIPCLPSDPDKGKTRMILLSLRVSPDQRFLAYFIWERKTFLMFTGGPTRLWVLDLRTGRKRGIASTRSFDSLVWSPDGEILYVSGWQEEVSGIYRVRMADYFDLD